MTKTYNIIHLLDGYMYMVDKEADTLNQWIVQEQWDAGDGTMIGGNIGQRIVTDKNPELFKEYYNMVFGHSWDRLVSNAHKEHTWTIIATNNTKFNLPLLPEIDNIEQLANNCAEEENKYNLDKVRTKINFIKGYKAAKAKKYTEEDIWKIWIAGRKFQSHNGPDFKEFIKTLSPKPIAVELEIQTDWKEHTKIYMESFGDNPEDFKFEPKLKLDENNFVNALKWIYE